MTFKTKMKIKSIEGGHQVLYLVNHPMQTGQRKDSKTRELIPAHYIELMTFQLNGNTVAEVMLGQGVSKNPLIGIEITGANTGDNVSVSWTDNMGESGGTEIAIPSLPITERRR